MATICNLTLTLTRNLFVTLKHITLAGNLIVTLKKLVSLYYFLPTNFFAKKKKRFLLQLNQ